MAARLCTMISCSNETIECYCGSGEPDVCEQHAREMDLAHDLEEFKITRDYVSGFAKVAQACACRRLMEPVDAAGAEFEMCLSVIEAERGTVWK